MRARALRVVAACGVLALCGVMVYAGDTAAAALLRGGSANNNRRPEQDLAKVHNSIVAQLIPASADELLDNEVSNISQTLDLSSGTWNDVDYADSGRSWWGASEHLRRTLLMASTLASPHSVRIVICVTYNNAMVGGGPSPMLGPDQRSVF